MRERYGRKNPHAFSAGSKECARVEEEGKGSRRRWEKGRSDSFVINALLFFLTSLPMLA